MLIFDAHLDLAWNAIDWNRDLRLEVSEIRQREISQSIPGKGRGVGTVSFPALRQGKVGIFIATLLARLMRPGMMPPIQRYESMEAAYGAARGQLGYYQAMVEEGELRFIKTGKELEEHATGWKKTAGQGEPLGFILSMEGADPVLNPEQVHHWFELGLRIIGPAHYGVSPYAHGTSTEGGLFPPGPKLLKEMEKCGMILDVTHLSDQCFDEAMDLYGGPVLASHHNCRALVPDQRQLTDEQIKKLIARGAVIGGAFDTWMLVPNWVRGKTTPQETGVSIRHVVDHIDRVCQLAGNTDHAGLGTDLDGGFGREQSPVDLDSITDLASFPTLLKQRGYAEADVEKICHGNWIRFFKNALPTG
ncbi:MAG: peptidase M19 [Gemmataceae bacterium]|nr:peptidase M19 [Gemmataceae bacterium]